MSRSDSSRGSGPLCRRQNQVLTEGMCSCFPGDCEREKRRYATIVADPPWPLSWSAPATRLGGEWGDKKRRSVTKRDLGYSTMSVQAICDLRVSELAEDSAHLYLWVPDRWLISGDAARVAKAWEFEPMRLLIWAKAGFGLGHFPRPAHEAILLCRRGGLPFADLRNVGSVQSWKQPYEQTGRSVARKHSAKPEGAYDLIEQASPGPYLELFARRNRLGWDTWGNESLEHVEVVA